MTNMTDKVRIIVVGDSGVGKTSLAHLIAHSEPIKRAQHTVGCNIEIKLHEYKDGTPQQETFFIELYDIGGSENHKNTRSIFYTPIDGIILVHDLKNCRSQNNLREWLMEIVNHDRKDMYKPKKHVMNSSGAKNAFDPEEFVAAYHVPILVIGTKLDLMSEVTKTMPKSGGIAEHCGAEEIWLSCLQPRYLAAGTSNAVKLVHFFDRVIERQKRSHDFGSYGSAADRRKHIDATKYKIRQQLNA